MTTPPRINRDRLLERLATFNRIGALPGGGNCRLALSDEDRAGRDLLVEWMRELSLAVTIDAIGNIIGVRSGRADTAAVMFGSSTRSRLAVALTASMGSWPGSKRARR